MTTLGTRRRQQDAPAAEGAAPPTGAHEANRARLRLRRRLMLFGLPVVLAVAVVAGWLLSLSSTAGDALQSYSRNLYSLSAERFGDLLEPNIVEQWIPYYDRGTALAAGADYVPAIDDFERALTLVPDAHECEVVVNLSLGWEKLADGYAQAGLFDGAALLYQTAADVLSAHTCTPPDEPVQGRDPGQEIEDAQSRLKDKIDASQFLGQDDGAGAPSTPEDRLDQLNEQGDGAAGDKAQDDARQRGELGTGGFADKPW